jgi:capsular exopolysaccharide synthesis family protein
LWVLPAGPVPPNPADLLASEAIVALLKELEGRYEHVILDSPPALAVTDATILSNLVDGVLLVIESGKTPRGGLLRTYRILEGAGARILGVVVNKFDFRLERYYGSYGYGYYRSYYSKYPYGNSSRS